MVKLGRWCPKVLNFTPMFFIYHLFVFLNMMNLLIWNARGVGGKAFVPLLLELRKKYGFQFLAILEPKQKREKAEWLRRRLGFAEMDVVKVRGLGGGIWCFWESETGFRVLGKYDQVLHGVFNGGRHDEWGLSVVYGDPNFMRRQNLWVYLRKVE